MALNQTTIDKIVALASSSDLARYNWSGRGRAPVGFVQGMAVVYGLCVQKLMSRDSAALAMVLVVDGKDEHDVFDHYGPDLRAINVVTAGAPDLDRLRALFIILTGLAMRESSGGDDIGQDAGAPENRTAEKAEAGLFQSSWNLRSANPTEIRKLFDYYSAHPNEGFADIFRTGTHPRPGAMRNYGDGDGAKFQELSKTCPAFAVQVAAIGARTLYTHWGPLIHEAAQVRPEADKLFKQVQVIVGANVPVSGQKPAAGWLSALVAMVMAMFKQPGKGQAPAAAPPHPDGTPSHIVVARKLIGIREETDDGNNIICGWMSELGGSIAKYFKTGNARTIPWCAGFIGWCLHAAGLKYLDSLWALDYAKYGLKLDGPAVGAIGPMGRDGGGHVAFVIGRDQHGNIMCIGGNQSNMVCVKPFPQERFVAFRWPPELPLPQKIGFDQLPVLTSDGVLSTDES